MKKLFFLSIYLSLVFCVPTYAYHVRAWQWLDIPQSQSPSNDYTYRIGNRGDIDIFVPGKDDSGVVNTVDWDLSMWQKRRPGSIRAHTIMWPLAGQSTTSCPGSVAGDTQVTYWSTVSASLPIQGSTTVLASSNLIDRLNYGVVQDFFAGQSFLCDFGAIY